MCFNQPMTGVMALAFEKGLIVSIVVYRVSKNRNLAIACFYFFLMEFLQFFQYFWIDRCDLWINKFLTVLGWAHIAWQPYFCQLFASSSMVKKEHIAVYKMVRRLAFWAGVLIFGRWVLANFGYGVYENTEGWGIGYDEEGRQLGWNSTCGICTEWIRGRDLCTYSGRYHLAWSIPLATPTYFVPGGFLHVFMMFSPWFLMWGREYHLILIGLGLFISGPFLSTRITDDLHEQGAVWCFLSITQIIFLVGYAILFDKKGGWVRKKKND